MGRTYWNKRILHRYLAYITVIPLFITMTTGFLYKILRDLIGIEKEKIKFLMKIHQCSFLFPNSEVFYTTILMFLCIALVIFGYCMIYNPLFGSRNGRLKNRNRWVPQSMREYHHRYGSVIFILLLFMALTGGVYRFLRNAVGIEKSSIHWLLDLHEMSYLPNFLSVLWITFIFVSLLSIAISGSRLLPIIHKIFQPANSYQILSNNNNNTGGNGNTSIGINQNGSSSLNSSNSSSSNSLLINSPNLNNQNQNENNNNSGSNNSSNIININELNNSNNNFTLNSSDGIDNSIINSNSMDDINNNNNDDENTININTSYEDEDDQDNSPFRPILNDNRLESMD